VDQSYSQAGATTSYSWTSYPWISRIRKLAPLRPTRGRRTRGSSVFASWRHYFLLVDVVPVDQSHSQDGASTSYSWTSYPWINPIRKLAPLRLTRGHRTRGSVIFASWRQHVLLVDVVAVDQFRYRYEYSTWFVAGSDHSPLRDAASDRACEQYVLYNATKTML